MRASLLLSITALLFLSACASDRLYVTRPNSPPVIGSDYTLSKLSQADYDSLVSVAQNHLKRVAPRSVHITRISVVSPIEALASFEAPTLYYIVMEKVHGTWRAVRVKPLDPHDIII